jgi:hypothetical protein
MAAAGLEGFRFTYRKDYFNDKPTNKEVELVKKIEIDNANAMNDFSCSLIEGAINIIDKQITKK